MSESVIMIVNLSAPLSEAESRALDVLWYALMGSDCDVRSETRKTDAGLWYKVGNRGVAIEMVTTLLFPEPSLERIGALKYHDDANVEALMRKLEDDGLGKFSYLIVGVCHKVKNAWIK